MQGLFVTIDDHRHQSRIRLSAPAYAIAADRVRGAIRHELGGILVGWWQHDCTAVVQSMLPVPDSGAGPRHYVRRYSPAQRALDMHLSTHVDPRCGYVGEWHSHPSPQPPSQIDRDALSEIVRRARTPIALIVLTLTPGGLVVPHGLIGRPRWPRRVTVETAHIESM